MYDRAFLSVFIAWGLRVQTYTPKPPPSRFHCGKVLLFLMCDERCIRICVMFSEAKQHNPCKHNANSGNRRGTLPRFLFSPVIVPAIVYSCNRDITLSLMGTMGTYSIPLFSIPTNTTYAVIFFHDLFASLKRGRISTGLGYSN